MEVMADCQLQKVRGRSAECSAPTPRPPFIVFDPNHDARFEAMLKHSKSAQVLRRHEDLRKRCEKEVRTYERWQKLTASELRQSQARYMEKLRKLKLSLARHFIQRKSENSAGSKQPQESQPVANTVPHYIRVRKNSVPAGEDEEDAEKTDDTSAKDEILESSRGTAEGICEALASSGKKPRPQTGNREVSPASLVAKFEKLRLSSSSVPLTPRVQSTQSSPRTPRVYRQAPRMIHNDLPSPRMLGADHPSQRNHANDHQKDVSDAQKSPRGFTASPRSPRILGFGQGSARAIKLSPNSSRNMGLSLRSPRMENVPPAIPKIAFASPMNSPRIERTATGTLPGTNDNRCGVLNKSRSRGSKEFIEFVELTDLHNPEETARLIQNRSRQRCAQSKKKAVTFVI